MGDGMGDGRCMTLFQRWSCFSSTIANLETMCEFGLFILSIFASALNFVLISPFFILGLHGHQQATGESDSESDSDRDEATIELDN